MTSFLKFLAEEWQKYSYSNIIGKRRLVMGVEDVCYTFTVTEDGSVIRNTNEDLACNHEEADTQIVLHLAYISNQTVPNVVIRCNDTDVFIVLLYHLGTDNIKANVWMDAGMDSSNTRRFIDMTSLATLLGKSLCSALPGLHSFMGSDYTSAFLRKGKVCPLQLMEKSTLFVNAFTALGESPFLTSCYQDILEAFVCTLYGKHNMQRTADIRYALFRIKYAPTSQDTPLARIKGADASVLPPCGPVLQQKIKRANYVTYIWKHASEQFILELDPCNHGWSLVNDEFTVNWFDGLQIPSDIGDAIDPVMFEEDGG